METSTSSSSRPTKEQPAVAKAKELLYRRLKVGTGSAAQHAVALQQ
jgi:hypothetical protein